MAWKIPLDGIMSTSTRTPLLNFNSEEARPYLDACIAHLGLERQARLDYATVSESIRDYVVRQMAQSLPAPLRVVCPLVARTYRLGMVLYDAAPLLVQDGDEGWHPTCTWDPPTDTLKPYRYVHLLQRRETLQVSLPLR